MCVVDTTEATAMAIVVEVVWWQWQKLRERPLHNSEQRDNNRFFSEFSAFSLSLLCCPMIYTEDIDPLVSELIGRAEFHPVPFPQTRKKLFVTGRALRCVKQSKTKNKPPKVQDTGWKTIAYIYVYVQARAYIRVDAD